MQVTLIPRGQAKGLTWFLPGEDPSLLSKQQIFARVVGALGGRAAEEVIFGDAEVTTGASGDLQQVPARLLLRLSSWGCWSALAEPGRGTATPQVGQLWAELLQVGFPALNSRVDRAAVQSCVQLGCMLSHCQQPAPYQQGHAAWTHSLSPRRLWLAGCR